MFLQNIFKKPKQQDPFFCQSCKQSSIYINKTQNQHSYHRTIPSDTCKIQQSLALLIRISDENAFQIFQVLNQTNTFPMLRNLYLKFFGDFFKWVHFSPDPFGELYYKIWDDLQIEELIFDISEIKFIPELFQVFFRDFEDLSDKLQSLNLNLFNSNLGTPEIQQIMYLLSKFNKLEKLNLNLRRLLQLDITQYQFWEGFENLFDRLTLYELTLNLSQLRNNNDPLILDRLMKVVQKSKVQRLSLSFGHSQFDLSCLEIVLTSISQMYLTNLNLDFSYNDFGEGYVEVLLRNLQEVQFQKIDLKLDGCRHTEPSDIYLIQKFGLNFIKDQSYYAKFSLPINLKREFQPIQRQFDWLQKNGKILWRALYKSELKKRFRKELLYEIIMDFFIDV